MSEGQLEINNSRGHVFLFKEQMGVTVGKCIACVLPVLSAKGIDYDCPNAPDS